MLPPSPVTLVYKINLRLPFNATLIWSSILVSYSEQKMRKWKNMDGMTLTCPSK